MQPSLGLYMDGSKISALTPQVTVVSPIRTRADPLAVEIDPRLTETARQLRAASSASGRPSGRNEWGKKRLK